MVRKSFPAVTLIENEENSGFAKANNQAVAVARGEYICILNPDTVVAENTFTTIFETMPAEKNLGIIGPRLINGIGNFLPESKRNVPTPAVSLSRFFNIKVGNHPNYYADHIKQEGTAKVKVLVGAFMFCRKQMFEAVDGFDKDYFMYGEDIDISYKMIKNNFENYYFGAIPVIHYKGESTDRNTVYIERFYGAMQLFYKKHFKTNWLLDALILIGIKGLSFSKSFQKNNNECPQPSGYLLISENKELQQKISAKLSQKIPFYTNTYLANPTENTEIIFDASYNSYQYIIQKMMELSGKNNTFKIVPNRCNFMLGSNQSDGKGEVILF